jgi:hypothetical protein
LLFVKDKRGHSPLAYARRTHCGQWNKYVNSLSDTLEPALLNVGKEKTRHIDTNADEYTNVKITD